MGAAVVCFEAAEAGAQDMVHLEALFGRLRVLAVFVGARRIGIDQ